MKVEQIKKELKEVNNELKELEKEDISQQEYQKRWYKLWQKQHQLLSNLKKVEKLLGVENEQNLSDLDNKNLVELMHEQASLIEKEFTAKDIDKDYPQLYKLWSHLDLLIAQAKNNNVTNS